MSCSPTVAASSWRSWRRATARRRRSRAWAPGAERSAALREARQRLGLRAGLGLGLLGQIIRLRRVGHLDAVPVEDLLEAPVELAPDRPLLARQRLDPHLDDEAQLGELVDADHLERGEDEGLQGLILGQLGAD